MNNTNNYTPLTKREELTLRFLESLGDLKSTASSKRPEVVEEAKKFADLVIDNSAVDSELTKKEELTLDFLNRFAITMDSTTTVTNLNAIRHARECADLVMSDSSNVEDSKIESIKKYVTEQIVKETMSINLDGQTSIEKLEAFRQVLEFIIRLSPGRTKSC
jgi:hypothetical protein